MDDMKKTYREGEETAKEAWRKADGEESLTDAVGNAGDDIRKDLGNAGDDMRREGQEAVDDDKEGWRRGDGHSVADDIGNAGDDMRRELDPKR